MADPGNSSLPDTQPVGTWAGYLAESRPAGVTDARSGRFVAVAEIGLEGAKFLAGDFVFVLIGGVGA